VISVETNNGNSNVVRNSNEKIFYYHPNTQKLFVCMILCELDRLAKNPFSARQNAFFVNHQNLLKQITGIFPVVLSTPQVLKIRNMFVFQTPNMLATE
jgi:hypothetical protein